MLHGENLIVLLHPLDAAVVGALLNKAFAVAIREACGDLNKAAHFGTLLCQFEQVQRTLDIALDCHVQLLLEVDVGGTVDKHVDGLN